MSKFEQDLLECVSDIARSLDTIAQALRSMDERASPTEVANKPEVNLTGDCRVTALYLHAHESQLRFGTPLQVVGYELDGVGPAGLCNDSRRIDVSHTKLTLDKLSKILPLDCFTTAMVLRTVEAVL